MTQPFTGAFDVRYGTLQVDGALPSSCEVSVQNGATLSGTGTTVAVTVYAGGTLAPGDSPGILATDGVTLDTGATFSAEVNGATAGTDYDQVVSSGVRCAGGFYPEPERRLHARCR